MIQPLAQLLKGSLCHTFSLSTPLQSSLTLKVSRVAVAVVNTTGTGELRSTSLLCGRLSARD